MGVLRRAAPASGNAAALPYSYGLDGVSIQMDNMSSTILYASIAFVALLVIAVRLAQRTNAHLRHLFTLSATPSEQRYWMRDAHSSWAWFKQHFLYAPIGRKRHHREFQLSQAINVGTLPSRLQSILLILFLISNTVYMCALNYAASDYAALLAELRGRSGHLSVANMMILYLFAGRNNPLIRWLRVSFDTFNLFHRWIGRVAILEAVVHTCAWAANKHAATGDWSGLHQAFSGEPFLQVGTLAMISMILMLFHSPSAIRHAFYEIFLAVHQTLAFLVLLGVFWHIKLGHLPQLVFIVLVICFWCYDRIMRLCKILRRNWVRSQGWTRVTVEALPGEACRVTFHLPRPWNPRPGSHVYAYLPSVSWWMSHPFSIAWASAWDLPESAAAATARGLQCQGHVPARLPPRSSSMRKHKNNPFDTEKAAGLTVSVDEIDLDLDASVGGQAEHTVTLLCAARSGMTRKLYERASAAPKGMIQLSGSIEGPYGGLESLHSYGTVVLFAGGIGITHQLGHIRDLLLRCGEPAPSRAEYAMDNVESEQDSRHPGALGSPFSPRLARFEPPAASTMTSSTQGPPLYGRTTATRRLLLVWTVRSTEHLEQVRPWMESLLALPARRRTLRIELFVTRPRQPGAMQSASQRVQTFAGRPDPAVIVRREFDQRVGAMCVGVCGPGALADEVRSATRGVVQAGKVDFWEEGFTW